MAKDCRSIPATRLWPWKVYTLGFVVFVLVVSEQAIFSSALMRNNITQVQLPKHMSAQKLSGIKKRLRAIKNQSVKSIQDFPVRPYGIRSVAHNYSSWEEEKTRSAHAFQTWHLSGSCPEGTIPVRRTSMEDLMRAEDPAHYGRKTLGLNRVKKSEKPNVINGNGHEHAIGYVKGEQYYGAKATINVWDPQIDVPNEFSLSQMWVLSGSFDGYDLNSIEAGWQVSPELYGDSRPRLFTYWTSDSYQETGCYNLLCSGFIQTNAKIAIGAAITPVSSFNGPQYDITILIWKDPKEGNWWMEFADSTLVGYWPFQLFTHLADHASMVEWGGEVVNMQPGGDHTSTQMGSGHFADEGFTRASYFRNLQVVDADNSLRAVDSVSTLAEHTNCYNIQSSYSADWGNHFYFGGPGHNNMCP
eukprot:Gb_19462 [translate_table: standard]